MVFSVMRLIRRTRMCRARRAGFSLVELTVAITIIGVIAAIAVPRVSRGAQGAGGAATKADLAVLRQAIDIYAAEHGGAFPGKKPDGLGGAAETEAALISQMLKFTDFNGNAADTRAYPYVYGPYLAKRFPPAPVGAFAGSSQVSVTTTGPQRVSTENFGWVYNVNNGEIILNTAAIEESKMMQEFELSGPDIGIGL